MTNINFKKMGNVRPNSGAAGKVGTPEPSKGKMQIHNLIIVDESGSMWELEAMTKEGVNSVIDTIREAQKTHGDTQEHFLTVVTFRDVAIRTIIDGQPIDRVGKFDTYSPFGSTPLYDAMGESLTTLHERIKTEVDATAVVTILTDGLENCSMRWSLAELKEFIENLKEEGWTFSYMGSEHNVKEVTASLSIDNAVEFAHDTTGVSNTWSRERSSRRAYYDRMANEFVPEESAEEKRARRRQYNLSYYGNRVTPEKISRLQGNEVFVFGSNANGRHTGGASQAAMRHFGAVYGQGEGLQGQSYAIPTTGGRPLMREAIERFCTFAGEHPELRFYVTPIGCGNAGFSQREIAPMFKEAIALENVALPRGFWDALGLKM